ncbi:efflux RND transporter periplasmic adaptor subunit [Elongatibacter sediminis]|uniref:Efflux RND transporter periplasmic adaptor subunit n=1 Tax=Elongatibacter sediminis TaxID=3119006 RepID=A0AAW9RIK0_9GAMM
MTGTRQPKFPENFKMKIITSAVMSLLVCFGPSFVFAQEDHAEEEASLVFTSEELAAAGITVATVSVESLRETLRIPAEVQTNAYQTARVTPRIQAQVVNRHAQLGDHIERGQSLVTLSSVVMAEAQGELIVADREWQRVSSLGRKAVGESRYIEAEVARQQAFAKVIAYGMQDEQALDLLQPGNATKAVGNFDLLSPIAGTVLMDRFVTGELIEPGRVLFEISDESVLWVEGGLTSNNLANVEIGDPARVSVNGSDWFDGHVVQLDHQLNETTRTQAVRIAVDNLSDSLHPGQFAEAEITIGPGTPQIAVPNSALTLVKGFPVVFKLEDGDEFHPDLVEIGQVIGDWTVINEGIEAGDEIAVEGIFHLKSLLLKSSIGDAH